MQGDSIGRAERGASMRVALLAPLYEPVPPRLYGGTERVVSWLAEALVARGHDVTLFASGDSRTSARLEPVVERGLRLDDSAPHDATVLHLWAAEQVRRRARDFDIIHSHIDCLGLCALRGAAAPVVSTLHGRLDLGRLPELHAAYRAHLVSISMAQRGPVQEADWVANVYHGLPLAEYRFSGEPGDFAVFVGRFSPEKRPDVAIRVARRAGVPLVIAAKLDPSDRAYFDDVVRPLLRGPGVEFIGEVDQATKIDLLGRAAVLLFPILWPEPFGLAMIEAMACGTPVVARRCGSIPEVIEPDVTGIICDDDDQLVEAVVRARLLDRAACRREVERRFSAVRMAQSYEMVYRRLTAARSRRHDARSSLHHHHLDRARAAHDVHAHVAGMAAELEIDAARPDPEPVDAEPVEPVGEDGAHQLDGGRGGLHAQAKARAQ
jgi:glycosyltransferase involved in cell wall biosynthesis